MKLHELKYTEGSKKDTTRVGRGMGSGKGKTSTRGHKGQNSRSGGGVRPGFEGGQTPLFRRLPKIGFTNIFQKEYVVINIEKLQELKLTEVNHETLFNAKVIKNKNVLIKILGNGELTKKLAVKVNKVSKHAEEAIKAAGGSVELI